MKRTFKGAVTLAGSLALAGGTILATAGPAAAMPSPDSLAYATYAPTGNITGGPNGLAQSTGTTVDHNDNINGLVTTGTTTDTAGAASAFSKVTNVVTNDSALTWTVAGTTFTLSLSASQVSTSCDTSLGSSANIISGRLTETTQVGSAAPTRQVFNLPQHPSIDQTYTFAGATVVLNDHTFVNNTVLVQGVNLTAPTTPTAQTLTLATTSCTAAGSNPIANGGFEVGTTSGWTVSGTGSGPSVTVQGAVTHSGSFAAQVGPTLAPLTAGTSSISQTFIADGSLLEFWYQRQCTAGLGNTTTATLTDITTGTTTTVLAAGCVTDASFQLGLAGLTPGDQYTFTLTNSNGIVTPNFTYLDDVSVF